MGVVALKKSGLIYRDTFEAVSLDERWEISPNDTSCYELLGNALRLKSGVDPLFAFFSPLTTTEEFVIDLKNLYNPSAKNNLGGLTVFGTAENRLDMEEYYDEAEGTVRSYPWIRLVRSYNAYSAYWSEEGAIWNIEGTDQFDVAAPKVGLYLTGDESMDVEEISIFSSTKIKVTGLIEGSHVELVQAGKVVSSTICRTGMSEAELDVSGVQLPFSGNFVVRLPENNTFTSTEVQEIWGGDEYNFEPNADLYLVDGNGNELPLIENMEKFLGYVQSTAQDYKDYRILIRNNMTSGTIKSVKINITWPDGTPADMKLADLYRDINGEPAVKYAVLDYPSIAAGTATPFWLRVRRITDSMASKGISDVNFGINMISTYIN